MRNYENTRVVAVAALSGGSSKTTVAVNVAASLALAGLRVLIIDVDQQANGTAWLGMRSSRNIAEALVDGEPLAPVKTPAFGVDLVPSCAEWWPKAERLLAQEPAGIVALREALRRLIAEGPTRYDIVLIDTPPGLATIAATGAVVAAGEVLVPVEPNAKSLSGLVALEPQLAALRPLNPDVGIAGIVVSRMTRTSIAAEALEAVRERWGSLLIEPPVRERVRVQEAFAAQQPLETFDPNGDATQDLRAVAMRLYGRASDGTQEQARGQLGPDRGAAAGAE